MSHFISPLQLQRGLNAILEIKHAKRVFLKLFVIETTKCDVDKSQRCIGLYLQCIFIILYVGMYCLYTDVYKITVALLGGFLSNFIQKSNRATFTMKSCTFYVPAYPPHHPGSELPETGSTPLR